MRIFACFLVLVVSSSLAAQSGRVSPIASQNDPALVALADEPTVKQMFDETNGYLRSKAAEFEAKKVPFTDSRLKQLKLDQRQLAARYAATAGMRKGLAGDDFYYLGMLHWIAENLDGTTESLQKFVGSENAAVERSQTARSIIVVAFAKQKRLDDAEKVLADYVKNQPTKLTERSRMESELAKAYQLQKDFVRMAPHADAAYKAAKALLADSASRARGLDEILDSGTLVFEAYRDIGNQEKADAALDDMSVTAITTQSSTFYYYAVDNKIRYMIETGRKPHALNFYQAAIAGIETAFLAKPQRDDALRRLKARDKHYQLLSENAIELTVVDQWFPGTPKTFTDLKGKVVLLDFWATWCAPCLEAFPAVKDWHQEFSGDGLEILGVTRYYGNVNGVAAEMPAEIEYFKRFKKTHALPYDFVVGKGRGIQLAYGAMALPTAVLIDRKGVIRYIATGTSPTRLEEIRAMIVKLLTEK